MWHTKWFKIGLVVAVIFVFIIGLIMYRSLKSEKNVVEKQAQELLDQNGEFNAKTNEAQIAELKQALLYLAKEVGATKDGQTITDTGSFDRVVSPNINGSLSGASTGDVIIRMRAIEDRLAALESKSGISSASTPLASATTARTVQYIPLGAAAELTDRNGIVLTEFEVTLDPAEFPGYSNVNLEAIVRMSESVGTLSLNLYNVTDQASIANSDISTSSTTFLLTNSFTFKLATGRKTYRIWAKSSEGYTSYIQSARLKITY